MKPDGFKINSESYIVWGQKHFVSLHTGQTNQAINLMVSQCKTRDLKEEKDHKKMKEKKDEISPSM